MPRHSCYPLQGHPVRTVMKRNYKENEIGENDDKKESANIEILKGLN
jgi:hypothetical protein